MVCSLLPLTRAHFVIEAIFRHLCETRHNLFICVLIRFITICRACLVGHCKRQTFPQWCSSHFEVTLRKFAHAINGIFFFKFSADFFFFFFFNFAPNIDCGDTLVPPRRGGSNEYPQSMFWSKNKKNRYTPAYPNLLYKSGVKGGIHYTGMFS